MSELDIEKLKKKKFNISVENMITIGMVVVTVEVSRTEYDLKDQLIRETIMSTQEKVEENGEKLKDIDEKLFEIITKD